MARWKRITSNGQHPEKFPKHQCTYEISIDHPDIASFFVPAPSPPSGSSPGPEIPRLLARMIGMDNLPLEFSRSENLWNLLEHAFRQGQLAQGKSFQEMCPRPCRNTFRSDLVAVTKTERASAMSRYSGPFYVSLALDEGKTLGTYYLNFVQRRPSSFLL